MTPIVTVFPSRPRYQPSDAARAYLETAADFAARRVAASDLRDVDPGMLLTAAIDAAAAAVHCGRIAEVPPGEVAALTRALSLRFVDEVGLLEVAGGCVALR